MVIPKKLSRGKWHTLSWFSYPLFLILLPFFVTFLSSSFFSVFIFFLHLLPFPLSKRTKHEGIKKTFFIHFPFFHTSDFLLNVTCSLLNFFIFIYSCSNSRRLDFFLSVMTCKKQQEKKKQVDLHSSHSKFHLDWRQTNTNT